jgi:hypothetical protein
LVAPYDRQIAQIVIASTLTTLVFGGSRQGQRLLSSEEPGTLTPPLTPGMVEGTVTAVDSAGRNLRDLFGACRPPRKDARGDASHTDQVEGQRIEVTENFREGDMVKVSYEVRDGQNVVSSIDLIPGSRVAPGRHPASGESASRNDPYV